MTDLKLRRRRRRTLEPNSLGYVKYGSKEARDRLAARLYSKYTAPQIAAAMGVSLGTVRRAIKAHK